MLKWPDKAREAIRKLFEPLQDVDVYIEDVNDEAFYRCLLNHATQGQISIARVFELGGRKAVLDAAAAHDHAQRRALFIIDGDLEWVGGKAAPTTLALHRHEAYCVENLLISEDAVATVLSQDTAASEAQARAALRYTEWRDSICGPLAELFGAFVASHVHAPALPTISRGVGRLCSQVGGRAVLDVQKVAQARDDTIQETIAVCNDAAAVNQTYAAALARINSLADPMLSVSGKDFLFPLLHFRLKALGSGPTTKSLRFRLAGTGNPQRFKAVADALRKAAAGWA